MKKPFLLAAVITLSLSAFSFSAVRAAEQTTTATTTTKTESPANTLSEQDRDFTVKAYQANLAEVKTSELASSHASASSVKTLSKHFWTDHAKSNKTLVPIAEKDHLTLPKEVNADQKAQYAELDKLHGKKFDSAFLTKQIADHEQALALFQKEASQGTNPRLKQYASATVPVIRQHLEMLKARS